MINVLCGTFSVYLYISLSANLKYRSMWQQEVACFKLAVLHPHDISHFGGFIQGQLCGTNLLSKIIWFHCTDIQNLYFTGPSLKCNGIKAHIRFIVKFQYRYYHVYFESCEMLLFHIFVHSLQVSNSNFFCSYFLGKINLEKTYIRFKWGKYF